MTTKKLTFEQKVLAKLTKANVKKDAATTQSEADAKTAKETAAKAKLIIEKQIATLNLKKLEAQKTLEDAENNLEYVTYPIEIGREEYYINDITDAKNRLTSKEGELKQLEVSITFYKGLLEEF